jgi:hypothetical protein
VLNKKNINMKNPFEKNDHKVLIAGIIVGSAVAGAVAYLFLTETGANVRKELTGHVNRIRDAVMGIEKKPEPAPEPEYIHHEKPKAPKTDREALKKHEIIGAPEHGEPGEESSAS